MRRDFREAINEEVDKTLQGFVGIFDLVRRPLVEKGPLSSRLRKRKLNSAWLIMKNDLINKQSGKWVKIRVVMTIKSDLLTVQRSIKLMYFVQHKD